jgi:TPR repeat protein
MPPLSTPETYFHLFQQELDACHISDAEKHAEGKKSLRRQIKQCITQLKLESTQNNPEVWYALGHASSFYERDASSATLWYQRAAEAGHTKAITQLGKRLKHSQTPEDQKQSLTWLNKAAQQGDAQAMLSLGCSYRDGDVVTPDLTQAEQWLQKAHHAGEPRALKALADLHFNHLHSPANALPYYVQLHNQREPCDEILAAIYNTRRSGVYNPRKAKAHYDALAQRGKKSPPWVMLELAKLHASGQVSENGLIHAKKWIHQIIVQCPPSSPVRKKAEQLLTELEGFLF